MTLTKRNRTLYFDLDGVLADFDCGAGRALNTDNIYKFEFVYGSEAFWDGINANPNFFDELPVIPGTLGMWRLVVGFDPVILTALPKIDADEVDRQKRSWVARNLGANVPVITCLTHQKPDYCAYGDVLVDDRAVNKAAWEAKGGHFILHTGFRSTCRQLAEFFPLYSERLPLV